MPFRNETINNCIKVLFLTLMPLLFFFYAGQASFRNGDWLDEQNQYQKELNNFKANFTNDKNTLSVFFDLNGKSLFSGTSTEQLKSLTKEIEALDFVADIKTPLNVRLFSNSTNSIEFVSIQDLMNIEGYTEEKLLKDLSESVYFKKLISENFDAFLIVLEIVSNEDGSFNYQVVVRELEKIISYYPAFTSHYFSGSNYIEEEINNHSAKNAGLIIALTLCFICLFVAFAFKRLYYSFVVLYSVILSLLYTFSLFAWFEYDITAVSTILLSLILIIAFSDSLYILNVWRRELRVHEKSAAIVNTINQTWKPCLVTSFTTAIGFGSLYFSAIVPFRQLGLISIVAILGCYIIITVSNWTLIQMGKEVLPLVENKTQKTKRWIISWLSSTVAKGCIYNKTNIAISILAVHLFVALLFFVQPLRIDSNYAPHFLNSESSSHEGYVKLDRFLYANNTLEIIFNGENAEYFKDHSHFMQLSKFVDDTKSLAYVADVDSFMDVIGMLHKKVSNEGILPNSQEALSQELLFIEFMSSSEVNDLLFPYIDFNYSTARIHVKLSKRLARTESRQLLSDIKALALKHTGLIPSITGAQIYDYHLSNEVVGTQLDSALIIVLGISLLFVLLFGFLLGGIGAVANVLPFTALVGVLSAAKIEFDFAAIMAISINFGLMVDMSVHLLEKINHTCLGQTGKHLGRKQLREIIEFITTPISSIFITMLFCYAVFSFSNIYLLEKFGFLSLITLISATIVNLILIPATVYILRFHFPGNAERAPKIRLRAKINGAHPS